MGWKKRFLILACGVAALLSAVSPVWAADSQPTAPSTLPAANLPDELKFLIAENQKSFENVSWVSYHSEQTNTVFAKDGTSFVKWTRANDVIQKPPYSFVSSSTRTYDAGHNEVLNQRVTLNSVLGSEYFGMRTISQRDNTLPANINQVTDTASASGYESIDHLPQSIISSESLTRGANVFYEGAFGFHDTPLGEFMNRLSRFCKFDIQESQDGGHFFVVKCLQNQRLMTSLVFDANNGFLVSDYCQYLSGKLACEYKVSSSRFGDDNVPFPISFSSIDYKPGSGEMTAVYAFHTSNIIIKPPIEAGQFTLGALGVKDNTRIMYISSSGEFKPEVWVSGTLMPDLSVTINPRAKQVPLHENSIVTPPSEVKPGIVTRKSGRLSLARFIIASSIALCLSVAAFLLVKKMLPAKDMMK